MQKRFVYFLVLTILFVSLSLASANIFSDFWNKITGKVTENYGTSILASSFVLNPGASLSTTYDYSTLQYATNIACPLGNFNIYANTSNFCQHIGSGQIIGGYGVIHFNDAVTDVTTIKSIASELNLGCDSSCSSSTGYRMFYTNNDYNSDATWVYAGTCTLSDNANQSACNLVVSGSIKNLLLSRDSGGDFRPDPAIHSVLVLTSTSTNSSSNQNNSTNPPPSNQSNQTNSTNSSCTSECASGQRTCSGSYAKTCGNYDPDSCLEFNNGTFCSNGCLNGICQNPPSNQTNNKSNQTSLLITPPLTSVETITNDCGGDGCLDGTRCRSVGYRKSALFCSDNGFSPQLQEGSLCVNNFECSSNLCVSNQCISSSLLQRIIGWFRSIFGNN